MLDKPNKGGADKAEIDAKVAFMRMLAVRRTKQTRNRKTNMMKDLLNGQNKKYLQIGTSINGFSYFTGTDFALYISNNVLYFLNLLTGETGKIDAFSNVDILNLKCVSHDTFVVGGFEDIYIATFTQENVIIQKKYPIGKYLSSKSIDSTTDLSIIALSAYENLIVISKDKIEKVNLIDIQYSMTISPDGKYIVCGSEKGIKIVEATSLKIIKEIKTEAIPISISFTSNGKTLLYGDDYKNIVSIEIESEKTTQYENPYYSKPIYFGSLDEGNKFIVSFLSNGLGMFNVGKETCETINLNEFPSRYFQYASLINENIIAICVENLRTESVIDSIPTSDVVLLQRINNDNRK